MLPSDNAISRVSDYQQFSRKTKLWLNPDHITDLEWQLGLRENVLLAKMIFKVKV